MISPIETTLNAFNVTVEKGVKYWECIISHSDLSDADYKTGFTCSALAIAWAIKRTEELAHND